jgi:hypothetical protein
MHPSPTCRIFRRLRGLATGEFEQRHRVRALTGLHVEHEQARALSSRDRPGSVFGHLVQHQRTRTPSVFASRKPFGVDEDAHEQLARVPRDAPARQAPGSATRAAPRGPVLALGLRRPLCLRE